MARLFLDSNVFLYALGAASPYREDCRAILSAVGAGQLDVVTSSEVLQELLHVRSRRLGVTDATSAVRQAAGMMSEVLPVTGTDLLEACTLLDRHPHLSVRDALHVAVMRAAGITRLVSVDRDFDSAPGMERLDPHQVLIT